MHSPFVPTPNSPDWEKTDKSRKPLEHLRDRVHYKVPAHWLEQRPVTGAEADARRAAMQSVLDRILADAANDRNQFDKQKGEKKSKPKNEKQAK